MAMGKSWETMQLARHMCNARGKPGITDFASCKCAQGPTVESGLNNDPEELLGELTRLEQQAEAVRKRTVVAFTAVDLDRLRTEQT